MKKDNILDIHYKNYKIRKILRILIMLLSLSVIVLSVLSLFKKVSLWIPLLLFLLTSVLIRYRSSLEIKDTKKKD